MTRVAVHLGPPRTERLGAEDGRSFVGPGFFIPNSCTLDPRGQPYILHFYQKDPVSLLVSLFHDALTLVSLMPFQITPSLPCRACAHSELLLPEMCILRRGSMWVSNWTRPSATAMVPSKKRPTSPASPRYASKRLQCTRSSSGWRPGFKSNAEGKQAPGCRSRTTYRNL